MQLVQLSERETCSAVWHMRGGYRLIGVETDAQHPDVCRVLCIFAYSEYEKRGGVMMKQILTG